MEYKKRNIISVTGIQEKGRHSPEIDTVKLDLQDTHKARISTYTQRQ